MDKLRTPFQPLSWKPSLTQTGFTSHITLLFFPLLGSHLGPTHRSDTLNYLPTSSLSDTVPILPCSLSTPFLVFSRNRIFSPFRTHGSIPHTSCPNAPSGYQIGRSRCKQKKIMCLKEEDKENLRKRKNYFTFPFETEVSGPE